MGKRAGKDPGITNLQYFSLYSRHTLRKMVRMRPKQLILCLLAVLAVIILLRYWHRSTLDWEFADDEGLGHVRNPGAKFEKWIIVTTVRNPSEPLKTMMHQSGWKLLVVGDRKTPNGWKLPGAIYLDIKQQKALNYKIFRMLPYDSYVRKSIGYLYAIEHGAKYIYETDDDNSLATGTGLEAFKVDMGLTTGLVVNTKNLTFNPYPHFGQSTLWPRGYPLEKIGLPTPRAYKLCALHTPAIQQGIVNGDPDVDAMFRLTRLHGAEGTPLDLKFDGAAPPIVLPKDTFAPLNSQNTLYTAKAFWALILPMSVSQRATDIVRSYWSQRLLWLLGEQVGFVAPNTVQKRNPHSHLIDARDERDLYQETGRLVRFLRTWTCNQMFFFDCVSQLSRDMASNGFWKHEDADLVDAWITDLAQAGYAPPALRYSDTCLSDSPISVVFYPDEQRTTLPHSPNLLVPEDLTNYALVETFLSKSCGPSHGPSFRKSLAAASHKNDHLVLVVRIQDVTSIVAMEAMQKAMFPHVLYCGPERANYDAFHALKVSYVGVKGTPTGVGCVLAAMAMGHPVTGYLSSSDNILMLDVTQLPLQHAGLMWVTGDVDAYKPETHELCQQKAISCQPITRSILETFIKDVLSLEGQPDKFRSELRQCLVKLASDPSFKGQTELTWVAETAFYVPGRLQETLATVRKLFHSDNEKYDFLTVMAAECLELTVEYLQYTELEHLSSTKNPNYAFPFSFQKVVTSKDSPFKQHFCGRFNLS